MEDKRFCPTTLTNVVFALQGFISFTQHYIINVHVFIEFRSGVDKSFDLRDPLGFEIRQLDG